MSRYADIDALMQSIRRRLGIASLDNLLESEKVIVEEINSAPSIDIVLCKDCKHRPIKEEADEDDYGFNLIGPTEDDEICPCLVDDGWYSWMPPDDFFCGYGERSSE